MTKRSLVPRVERTFVVVKGNLDNEGEHRRWYDAMVIMTFAADVMRGTLRTGRCSMVLTVPDEAGMPALVDDRVISYVDIQRADSDAEVAPVVGALKKRMDAAGVPAEAVGHGIVTEYLERMYMRYDSWRDE